MKTFDVPDWMVSPFITNGVSESDYYLYGAGRALVFVRMAAHALDVTYLGQKVAEYHAYTGISAARTAIDAIAVWCNTKLQLDVAQGPRINLSKKDFQKKVSKASPEVAAYAQALGTLGKKINKHRQRAQHRQGLVISFHMDSERLGHLGGWYLAISGDPTTDLRLVDLLNGWADEIEGNFREIHKVLVMDSDEAHEAGQLLARLAEIKSSADTGCE